MKILLLLIYVHLIHTKFLELIVLGDSWSDSGNFHVHLNRTFPPNYNFEKRLCNGPVWTDIIHQNLGDIQMMNFAYANATCTKEYINNGVPGAVEQAQSALSYLNKKWPSISDRKHILVAYFYGSADYIFGAIPADIVNEYHRKGIEILIEAGIQHIVLAKAIFMPNVPHASYKTELEVYFYRYIYRFHLIFFDINLKELKIKYPNVKFYVPDFEEIIQGMQNSPPHELKDGYDTKNPCVLYEDPNTICEQPNKRLFWDLGHGNKNVQRCFGETTLDLLHIPYPKHFKSNFVKYNKFDPLFIFEDKCSVDSIPCHHLLDDYHLISWYHVKNKVKISSDFNDFK